MQIQQIKIKNFKGIVDLKLENLESINQFIGKNGAGKTSLNESLKFLFSGNAKDKNKIREGCLEASVSALMDVKGTEIFIEKILNEGGINTNLRIGGAWHKDTKSALVKNLFGIASFNPEEILHPKTRMKVFSALINEEFVYPEEIQKFQTDNLLPKKGELIGENPIEALAKIQKGLENIRLIVGREKDSIKSLYKDGIDNLKELNLQFITKDVDVSKIEPTEELLKQQAIADTKNDEKEETKDAIVKTESSIKLIDIENEAHEKEIQKLQNKISSNEGMKKEKIAGVSELKKKIEEFSSAPLELKEKIEMARLRDKSVLLKTKTDELEAKVAKSTNQYKEVNKFLQSEFSGLFEKYLSPIKKKITELNFKGGKWIYKGVDVDNLSRSETMDLALKLIEAQGKETNVVIIDNAEQFDKETIQKLAINTEGTAFMIMKVGEAFDIKSKVVEIKKPEKEDLKI